MNKDIIKLGNDPQIINMLKTGKGSTDNVMSDLLARAMKVLKTDSANTATRRLGRLGFALKNNTLDLPKINNEKMIKKIARGGAFSGEGKLLYGKQTSTALGQSENFVDRALRDIAKKLKKANVTGYNLDEIYGGVSSGYRGSYPYGVFGQIIRGKKAPKGLFKRPDPSERAELVNQVKGSELDSRKSIVEGKLQDIDNEYAKYKEYKKRTLSRQYAYKDFPEGLTKKQFKTKIINDYNKIALDFKKTNKVEVPLFSEQHPSKVVGDYKNFKIPKSKFYFEIGGNRHLSDAMDDVYNKHGYSMKVPKNTGTLKTILKDLDNPKVIAKLTEKASRLNPRLLSVVGLPILGATLGYQFLKGSPLEAAEVDQKTETELPKPETVRYDKTLGAFVNPADDVVSQGGLLDWAAENPIPVVAGTAATGLATKKGRAIGKGALKKLAALGAPLPTAAMDAYFIGRQIEEGRDPADIAKDPFNWLGLATMSPLTKAAGLADKSGKFASAMRLGMSPGLIRGISRFAGLPGLAISTGLTAYDQYKKYQDKEGFIYDLFNKVDNTDV